MPDNTNTTATAEGVTSKQEIPSSNTSADEKTPTETPTSPETEKNGPPEVSSASVGEVVLTQLKSSKEKSDAAPNKKPTITPKKTPGKSGLTKKTKGKSNVTREISTESKPATPKVTPQPTLSRQSTVTSTISTPGTPKKSVRLDISLDGSGKLGTPKKKLNRFRSKSPKKANSKMNGLKKVKPLRSSTPKRSSSKSNTPKAQNVAAQNKREGNTMVNNIEATADEQKGQDINHSPKREKSTSRAPKPQRKIFVSSTRPPKIKPRSQSPTKARKGKPSAWR